MKILDLHCGDGLDWLKGQAADSFGLFVTSPPYENARSYYGLKIPRGEKWVAWYLPFVVEMCRASRGFVAVNVAGLVEGFSYSGVDHLLCADLQRHHGIVQGPAPYAWVKAGIPGSGSLHYHRRNWEPVYLFADRAKLPPAWSDNTAFGEPCKREPGGEMSYHSRVRTGKRVNARMIATRPTERNNQEYRRRAYTPPDIANPGNILTDEGHDPNVIITKNGGGHTGHKLTRENEAPMNLEVASRLVRWFAPPDSLVGDPMAGSGTTGHAALMWGRRAALCDVRANQVELMRKRLSTITMIEEGKA